MGYSLMRVFLFAILISANLSVQSTKSYAGPSCTCRYAGHSFQVNSCVCITTSAVGPQVACCGMVVNNTSWTFTKNACPSAELMTAPNKIIEIAQSSMLEPNRLKDGDVFGLSSNNSDDENVWLHKSSLTSSLITRSLN